LDLHARMASPCIAGEAGTVSVVIDYGALGGGVNVYCARGLSASSTGFDALRAVGIGIAGTVHDGGAFVCRLGGRPGPGEVIALPGNPGYTEQCVSTPPPNAFWSYWAAAPGGGWSYMTSGGGSHRVSLGGFEGWKFHLGGGKASAPGFAPVPAPAPPPPPPEPPAAPAAPPAAPAAPGADSAGTGGGGRANPSSGARTGGATQGDKSADQSTDSADPDAAGEGDDDGDGSASPSSTSSQGDASSSAATASTTPSTSSITGASGVGGRTPASAVWATVGGVTGVGVLAGAGIILARRRKNSR
jgi:hypothetical protein